MTRFPNPSSWQRSSLHLSPIMSYSHQDHPYTSSRSSRHPEPKREERLPPLRHMVGDAYDFHDVKHSLPSVSEEHYSPYAGHERHSHTQRGPTLPPIYYGNSTSHGSSSAYSNHSGSNHSHSSHHHSGRPSSDYPSSEAATFGAFYASRGGDLVNLSTSSRPVGIIRRSDVPDEGDYDPRKRHKCPEPDCGKRFDRPSGLEQHRLRHTGEKPYPCTIPGCDKSFSARSNMTRHVRTQHYGESGDSYDHDGPRSSTYSSTSRGSSDKSSPSSASYYSSSRR